MVPSFRLCEEMIDGLTAYTQLFLLFPLLDSAGGWCWVLKRRYGKRGKMTLWCFMRDCWGVFLGAGSEKNCREIDGAWSVWVDDVALYVFGFYSFDGEWRAVQYAK